MQSLAARWQRTWRLALGRRVSGGKPEVAAGSGGRLDAAAGGSVQSWCGDKEEADGVEGAR